MDQQFEWLQSNAKIDYPFEPVQPESVKQAFVDALIIDETGTEQVVIYSLSLDGVVNSISVKYLYGADFFSGTPEHEKFMFGVYTVIRFFDTSANKHILLTLEITEPFAIAFEGRVVVRCTEPQPARVRSVTVFDQNDVEHRLVGDVIIAAGNNMLLNVGDRGSASRDVLPVTVNAVPGAGLGLQENDCTGDGYLRTLNGVGPDDFGRMLLDARDCYRTWRPIDPLTSLVIPSTIQLANCCETCCECDDYGDVYQAMQRLYNIGRDAGKMLANLNGKNKGVNDAAKSDRAKRSRRKFSLFLRPSPGNLLGVQITYLNNVPSKYDLGDHKSDMRITVACTADGSIISKTIYIYNSQYGEWRQLTLCQMFPMLTDCSGTGEYPVFYQSPTKDDRILSAQWAVTYFDLHFPDAAEGAVVTVTVESIDKNWYFADTTTYVTAQTASLIGDIVEESSP